MQGPLFSLFGMPAPANLPTDATQPLPKGAYLVYVTDAAKAAGHPVPDTAKTPKEREPLAWSGVLEGIAREARARPRRRPARLAAPRRARPRRAPARGGVQGGEERARDRRDGADARCAGEGDEEDSAGEVSGGYATGSRPDEGAGEHALTVSTANIRTVRAGAFTSNPPIPRVTRASGRSGERTSTSDACAAHRDARDEIVRRRVHHEDDAWRARSVLVHGHLHVLGIDRERREPELLDALGDELPRARAVVERLHLKPGHVVRRAGAGASPPSRVGTRGPIVTRTPLRAASRRRMTSSGFTPPTVAHTSHFASSMLSTKLSPPA